MEQTNFPYYTRQTQIASRSLRQLARDIRNTRPGLSRHPRKQLHILSIDGGGIRAILPAVILAELEDQLQKRAGDPEVRMIDYFDLFAGTSAGGVLTALYLSPDPNRPDRPRFSAQEVLNIYLQDGSTGFTPINKDKHTRRKEKYCSTQLEDRLRYFLGTQKELRHLIRPAMITAFDLDHEAPVYFKSWENRSAKLWQVIRATTAAPGMFAPVRFPGLAGGATLIDGSIFAGNPAMCAYALANHTRFSQLRNSRFAGDFPVRDDMLVVSAGTGRTAKTSTMKTDRLMRILMKNALSSNTELVDCQMRHLFSESRADHYYRFNPTLQFTDDAIDRISHEHVEALYQLARQYVRENSLIIEELVSRLL